MSLRILAVIGLAFALALCSGCMGYVTTRTTTVAVRPPAPVVEVATVSPNPGYVWVDGYWHWNGYDYEWVAGYWDVPPTVGYVWDPGGWVVVNGGYTYVAGRWVAPGYRSNVTYVHPRRRVVVRPQPRPRAGVVVRSNVRPRTVVRSRGGPVVRTGPGPRSSVVVRSGPAPRSSVSVRGPAPRSSVSVRGSAPARGSARASRGGRTSVRAR